MNGYHSNRSVRGQFLHDVVHEVVPLLGAGVAALVKRARLVLTLASLAYLGLLVWLVGDVSLPVLNVLLIVAVAPILWLLGSFCVWSVHQHARREARDIEKVHGGRPVRLPERAR